MPRHYDITPSYSFADFQSGTTALLGYYRGGDEMPDAGCTVRAACSVAGYATQQMEGTGPIVMSSPCPDKEAAIAALESAAKESDPKKMKAIPWTTLLVIAKSIICGTS